MKFLYFFIFQFFILTNASSFTVLSNPPAKFPTGDITVNVAGNSCAAAGFTTATLLEWTGEAMDDFWNGVSTSSINLALGTVTTADKSGVTDDNFSTIFNDITSGTILISCNDLVTNFDASTSSKIRYTANTLAVGSIGTNSSGSYVGIVLVNTAASYQTDHLQDVAVIAHEMGHALGIGHSTNQAALMYYSTGAVNNYLAEDDRDAISYLYPKDESIASCGSVALLGAKDDDDFSGPMNVVIGFVLMSLLMSLIGKLKKTLESSIITLN